MLPKAKFELEFSHGSTYGEEEKAAVLEVLEASAPSCGAKVQQFEHEFATYCGARHGLAVSSATAGDRKSTRLNSSHQIISYAVFCLKKKKKNIRNINEYAHDAETLSSMTSPS